MNIARALGPYILSYSGIEIDEDYLVEETERPLNQSEVADSRS